MSVQQKIFSACIGFVAIIAILGGLAWRQAVELGQLAIGIHDHGFIGMSYVDKAQEEFLRLAAALRDKDPAWPTYIPRTLDRLDVALERAGTPRTRAAAIRVRELLTALPDTAVEDLAGQVARTDQAIGHLIKGFSAESLQSRDAAEAMVNRSIHLVLTELVIALCLAAGIGWLVGRNLSQPLIQLVRVIGGLAAGELKNEVTPKLARRRDEIGKVARAATIFREAMQQNVRSGEERERLRERAEADRREAEKREAAALELNRMRLLSDMSQEVLIIARDEIILQVNAAGDRMFAGPGNDPIGRRLLAFIWEADHAAVIRRLQRYETDLNHEEIHLIAATGTLVPVEFSCSPIEYEGEPAMVMAFRDLSDRKRDEARIRHLAHHDALTDLPNRFLLRERLTHAVEGFSQARGTLALLYLDLDCFKPVNDLLGHAAGDALLVQVAARLQAELRSTDTLARVGGDEFVIIASVDQPEQVAVIAGRLIATLTQPFKLGSEQVEIGTSIGIALYPRDGDHQEALMHAADTALYRAKHDQRGTFRFFETTMNEHLLARQRLERDLRHALEREELQLYYQPIVSCVTGDVLGFEALLRWHHPELGLVPPLEFVPLAEKTGVIGKIGQWALETACEAAAAWKQPYWVAVNVSPVQFRQSDLPTIVSDTLARTGLAASRLEIEITEGILMEDPKRAADVLSTLRAQGVRIALDDFGTGYSSLSYLHAFRFDKLKIDRSFIIRLGEAGDATIIVRAIIGLAHSLGLLVVAEGVETAQQLAIVREFTGDQAQGYLLGRPMQVDGSTELMAARAKMLVTGRSKAENRVGLGDDQPLQKDGCLQEQGVLN